MEINQIITHIIRVNNLNKIAEILILTQQTKTTIIQRNHIINSE